jgi:phage terminase large subunit GpA-like protein
VPTGVGVLVAAVDVQGDRLEAVVKGYGADEESWLIAFTQIHGDPAREQVWHELDRFLGQRFEHESGQKLRIHRTVVDSGGHHTEQVYRYCKGRLAAGRSVYPVKGGTLSGRPLLVERPSIHNRYRVPLFVLCVDTGKEIVFSRLLITSPGPGYLHLPDWVDAEYLAQLTAEKAIRKYVKGRGAVREWVKLRERNEALDLEVYSLAALYILGPAFVRSLPERAARFAQAAASSQTPDIEAKAPIEKGPSLLRPWGSAWVRAGLPQGYRR